MSIDRNAALVEPATKRAALRMSDALIELMGWTQITEKQAKLLRQACCRGLIELAKDGLVVVEKTDAD